MARTTWRGWFLGITLGFLGGLVPASAQENLVQNFDGTGSLTTPLFKTNDKWEVEWDSSARLEITVLSANGEVVAGTSTSAPGSFYQPKGGSFYLQVERPDASVSPWHIRIVELSSGNPPSDAVSPHYMVPLSLSPPPGNATNAVASVPPPAVTNAAPVPLAPAKASLTQDQSRAIVVIKGDNAEGTGFLAHTPDGPVVVTNNHVIAANPNIKILTSGGASISILSLKGAVDRDLVMFSIKDDNYSYLDLSTDVEHTVLKGDEVLTPGNGLGGEVVLTTDGQVVGVGPERIEVDNPIYHGNSGGPIFQVKTGKVIGVVTMATKVQNDDALDKASYDNLKSAILGPMRYFGFRLDSVPKWETYDWNRFLDETTFLKQFHQDSRYIDSFLNGAIYEKAHVASSGNGEGAPDSHFYLGNDKLRSAAESYQQVVKNSDQSQKLDARREMVMSLQGFADKDMSAIQTPDNFYGFDQIKAKREIAYRNALKTEIDNIGNKISDVGH